MSAEETQPPETQTEEVDDDVQFAIMHIADTTESRFARHIFTGVCSGLRGSCRSPRVSVFESSDLKLSNGKAPNV